ncbi:MAG: transcription termination/antitermination protein NusA [Candidatus Omnitrophica bacterium]|nr:transcription termination/antitermination protein NusA [Candidatus Omnitrophota bacterium]MBU4140895.1 transcription termination factor NusA [Candidatus Omnitrophota bacterium]
MNEELLSVLEHIEREKGIKKEILIQAVEQALLSAARKDLGPKAGDIQVKLNPETGAIQVISDGKEVTSGKFGRIAAQTAKQVIIQKIREAERDVIYEDFHKKVDTLTNGLVHRFEKGNIIIDLGKTEAILPKSEQSPKETYRQGERIRAYILEVKKTPRGPHIVLSRTHAGMVRRMFELEVPEIYEGIVQIKGIARQASERTKIAVYSNDEKIDCVGACVGMRGSRVKEIVRELRGEKIDIVRWSEDTGEFIAGALSPAKVLGTEIDKAGKVARVLVDDDQLSLAIGKRGQNVRLASRLTGWNIDIRSKAEAKEKKEKEEKKPELTGLAGIGQKSQAALIEAGFKALDKLAKSKVSDLIKIKGIGKKKAEKIIAQAKENLSREENK